LTKTKAFIVLKPGQSLTPEEVKAYDGKIVKVVGQISRDLDQKLNPSQSITLTAFDGIWQYQSKF
jgi:hypothetical protein